MVGLAVFSLFVIFLSLIIISPFTNQDADGQEELICMDGEIPVQRGTNSNPICIEESTAKRWVELGIATYYEVQPEEQEKIKEDKPTAEEEFEKEKQELEEISEQEQKDLEKELSSVAYNPGDFIFVQTANSGTFFDADGDGTFTLTLVEVNLITIYFSNDQQRVSGHELTEVFIAKWGHGDNSFADNPPNAIISILDGDPDSNVTLVELFNPVFSPESETLQYDVILLGEDGTKGLKHHETYLDKIIHGTFEKVVLFIEQPPKENLS